MYRIFSSFTVGPFTLAPEGGSIRPGDSSIILGRQGAFGSGEHETTQCCLEELAKLPSLDGAEALDLGCGTGILAIAAARLGACRVVALDIDPRAAASCAANVRLNGVVPQVVTVCGELNCLGPQQFDLVMANIYADVHEQLATDLAARTRPGGHLLLSGIPTGEHFPLKLAYQRAGCELLEGRFGEEFVTYVMRRS